MTPKQQLDLFLDKFTPQIATLARAALAHLRRKFPRAVIMIYDNYSALAIGFGPTERPSEAAFSIVLYPKWVRLFFLEGVALPDPAKRLEGTGKQVRSVVLEGVKVLEEPAIARLLEIAAANAGMPSGEGPPGKMMVRAISLK